MLSEFSLIARYFTRPTPQAELGPGDDCALLAPSPGMALAITTDMLIEGTHFLPGTDPYLLGWKTLAVNLSELAAMGAQPRWALLALSLPEAEETWLAAFSGGLFACAGRYGVDLIGGDTTRGPRTLSITALGETPCGQALRRDGARAGDELWVSGQPGRAALGLAQLLGQTRLPAGLERLCLSALQQPLPRVELGLALRQEQLAHAAIDISDGLLADVAHLAERSQRDIAVYLPQLPALPRGVDPALARQAQLSGGDDYELAFTAAPGQQAAIAALANRLDLPLWRIGRVLADGPGTVRLLDENGVAQPITRQGFDHFGQ